MRAFITVLLIAAVFLAGSILGLVKAEAMLAIPSFFWEIIIFLTLTTAFLFLFVVRAASGLFVQMYLLTMVLKLLGYGAFLFFVIWHDRQNAIPNVVLFLVGYLLFTAIEIFFLHRKTRGE